MKYKGFNEKFFIKKIIKKDLWEKVFVKKDTAEEIDEYVAKLNGWEIEEINKLTPIALNVSGKDFYNVIGLDPVEEKLLGKDLINGYKELKEKQLVDGVEVEKITKVPNYTKARNKISSSMKKARAISHPDKNGNTSEATEKFKIIEECKYVILDFYKGVANEIKKEYDDYWGKEINNDNADNDFKNRVKAELERRSKWADPTSGNLGISGEDTSGASDRKEKDV